MTTFLGLYWYEVVLLVLGIALFIVLLSALRSALAGGKSYTGMLPFFVISIAMMGYPSIKSIQYENGIVTIENDTGQIESDPNNTVARQQIEAQVEKLAPRATSAQDAAIIDRARAALVTVPNGNTAALRLRVSQLTNEVGNNPKNTALRQELTAAVNQLKATRSTNQLDIEAIQHGENILSQGPSDGGTSGSSGSGTNNTNGGTNTAALRQRVSQLTNEVGNNPKNTALRQELTAAVNQLKASGSTNPLDVEAIQRGESILSRP
jgi:hypothetical protein